MKKLIIILSLMFIACGGSDKRSYESGKITVKDDINLCEPACAKAKSLNCDEGKDLVYPTVCQFDAECESGKCISGKCTETCVDVCSALVRNGRMMGLNCWKFITSCDQIEKVCRNN